MFNDYSKKIEQQTIQNFKDRAKWLAEFASKNFEAHQKNKKANKEISIVYEASALFATRKLLDICSFLGTKDYFSDEELENFESLVDFIDSSVGFDSFNNEEFIVNIKTLIDFVIIPEISKQEVVQTQKVWTPTLNIHKPTPVSAPAPIQQPQPMPAMETPIIKEPEMVIEVKPETKPEIQIEERQENSVVKTEKTEKIETIKEPKAPVKNKSVKGDKKEKPLDIPSAEIPKEAVLQVTAVPEEPVAILEEKKTKGRARKTPAPEPKPVVLEEEAVIVIPEEPKEPEVIKPKFESFEQPTKQETIKTDNSARFTRLTSDNTEDNMPVFTEMPSYKEFMGNAPQATGRSAYLNNKFAEQDKLKGESIQIPPPANFRNRDK